jgi:hypothetical protein
MQQASQGAGARRETSPTVLALKDELSRHSMKRIGVCASRNKGGSVPMTWSKSTRCPSDESRTRWQSGLTNEFDKVRA